MKEEIKGLIAVALVALLALSVMPVALAVNLDNYPRTDEVISVICADETDMITKAQAGELDTCYDVRSPDN